LEDIIDLCHPLVRLAQQIDWQFLDSRFSSVCTAGDGRPPLPTRLVAGLFILKHMHNVADEVLCARWLENAYYQFFCGELSFRHAAVRPFIDPLAPAPGRGAVGGPGPGKHGRWRTKPEHWRRATSSGWWSTPRCNQKRSPTRPTRGCAIARCKSWLIWLSCCQTRPKTLVTFGLPHPVAQGLARAADLLGNRVDRRPL
jgi:IS5 family transposase